MGRGGRFRAVVFAAALTGLSLTVAGPVRAAVAQPAVKPIEAPGSPFLTIGAFDLKALGYVV